MSERTEALQDLKTTLIDSRSGYEEAQEDAEGRGLVILFQEMVALRTRHIEEINRHLAELGQSTDNETSFMSTVNRAAVSIRSIFTGLDAEILPSLISGEQSMLESYDEALAAADAADKAFLTAQRQEIADKIKVMEVLRDKAA